LPKEETTVEYRFLVLLKSKYELFIDPSCGESWNRIGAGHASRTVKEEQPLKAAPSEDSLSSENQRNKI